MSDIVHHKDTRDNIERADRFDVGRPVEDDGTFFVRAWEGNIGYRIIADKLDRRTADILTEACQHVARHSLGWRKYNNATGRCSASPMQRYGKGDAMSDNLDAPACTLHGLIECRECDAMLKQIDDLQRAVGAIDDVLKGPVLWDESQRELWEALRTLQGIRRRCHRWVVEGDTSRY